MPHINAKEIINNINQNAEKDRRARALKRHQMFKDGGRDFLVDQVRKEFGEDAVQEMRLVPINILKKIISMRSGVYKKPPQRIATEQKDNDLITFYEKDLALNRKMQKANKYYNLFSNTELYVTNTDNGRLELDIVTPYHYVFLANKFNREIKEGIVFSVFPDQKDIAPEDEPNPATGRGTFSKNKGTMAESTKISSDQHYATQDHVQYTFWTPEFQYITDHKGTPISNIQGDVDNFVNPLGIIPSVTLAKDRDNESYSTVGDDLIDIAMTLQLGWSDLLTIAKHTGFGQLLIISEEQPEKLTMGINRAVWLKASLDGFKPEMSYLNANAPLAEYKELLIELLAMLLSSNDLNPQSVGGTFAANQATSGFHALLQNADNMESIEADKPVMASAERELWQIIATYHNWLFDQSALNDEAKAMGKFSDGFEVEIVYPDAQPLQAESEVIANVTMLMDKGLLSRTQGLKKLNPEMGDDQIDNLVKEIELERTQSLARFTGLVNADNTT